MAGSGPSILLIASDRDERILIAAMLRGAGFAAVRAAEDRAALSALQRERFAAAVVALPAGRGIDIVRAGLSEQPQLPALLVLETAAIPLVAEDGIAIIERPFDPRRLLGSLFELILRDADGRRTAPQRRHAAECGIAAAKLACLDQRHAIAAASGASRLAHDLARQIGETRAMRRRFVAALAADTLPGVA